MAKNDKNAPLHHFFGTFLDNFGHFAVWLFILYSVTKFYDYA